MTGAPKPSAFNNKPGQPGYIADGRCWLRSGETCNASSILAHRYFGLPEVSVVHSAEINLSVCVGEKSHRLSQVGANEAIVADRVDYPPQTRGRIEVSIDGSVSSYDVVFPCGIAWSDPPNITRFESAQ